MAYSARSESSTGSPSSWSSTASLSSFRGRPATFLISLKSGAARGRYAIRVHREKPSGESSGLLEAPVLFEGEEARGEPRPSGDVRTRSRRALLVRRVVRPSRGAARRRRRTSYTDPATRNLSTDADRRSSSDDVGRRVRVHDSGSVLEPVGSAQGAKAVTQLVLGPVAIGMLGEESQRIVCETAARVRGIPRGVVKPIFQDLGIAVASEVIGDLFADL